MFYGLESQAVNPELRRNFSIPVIAAEFVRAMRQVQPKGPYLLAGYSLGGLIAFECATILLREGERVERLILIDSYAEVTGLRLPARAWFVLRGLLTMSKDERSAYLREKIIWIKRMAQVRVRARARSGAAVPLEEGTKHFELQKGAEYQKIGLRPCELRVDVIVARDGSRKFTSMSDHGWGQFALTGCRVHEVPGNHYSMLQQPNAQVLGKKLRELVEGED
jgi:thioesterase domain-containing protein